MDHFIRQICRMVRPPIAAAALALTGPAMADDVKNVPYEGTGDVSCFIHGTHITFRLNGTGGAVVTDVKSDYAPFRKAAAVKQWSANTVTGKGTTMLVLDNLNATRIMVAGGGHAILLMPNTNPTELRCDNP